MKRWDSDRDGEMCDAAITGGPGEYVKYTDYAALKRKRREIICEGCSMHAGSHRLPDGWCQCDDSRFLGVKLASWCPECTSRKAWAEKPLALSSRRRVKEGK